MLHDFLISIAASLSVSALVWLSKKLRAFFADSSKATPRKFSTPEKYKKQFYYSLFGLPLFGSLLFTKNLLLMCFGGLFAFFALMLLIGAFDAAYADLSNTPSKQKSNADTDK